ncbi:MAG: hypothetical protein JWM10_4900 [Myxococcaceae bacterium]|nr:hypothetical protein [Myxococcaceae bacterium]
MRSTLLLTSVLFALPACHPRAPDAPEAGAVAPSGAAAGAVAEHGGAMALSAELRAEVVAQPDGRVLTYVTNREGAPMQPSAVRVGLRRPGGRVQSVPVAYDPAVRAYVGRAAAVPPGQYPVEVSVRSTPTAPPVEMLTAPVAIVSTVQPPAPRHNGEVTVVGDRAVEVAIDRTGDVATFWTTLDGEPIAPAQVEAPFLVVHVGGHDRTVALRPSGGALVGHFAVGGHDRFSVGLPTVSIGGAVYLGAEAPSVVVVASIPGVVFVEEPVARPAFVVARPARPTLVYVQPAPTVLFVEPVGWGRRGRGHDHYDNGLHLGHDGRGRGHGRGH